MKSIRRFLLMWLFAGLAFAILLAVGLVYQRAAAEANRLFDDQMQQLVAALPVQGLGALSAGSSGMSNPASAGGLIIQWWDNDSLRFGRLAPLEGPPLMPVVGFDNVDGPGGSWRVYTARLPGGVIQVAQPQWVRSERAAGTALRTVTPMLVLFPLLGLLTWLGVNAGLRPLQRLTRELRQRSAESLQPVRQDGLPDEIRPLAQALNGLLQRLADALETQRSFLADAAHELRTPLTALKLQIQMAQRAGNEQSRGEAFTELHAGFERASHLVQQLLVLARQEPAAPGAVHSAVMLDDVVRQVVAMHPADTVAGRLVVDLLQPVRVRGDTEALVALVNNLVDNALRYGVGGGDGGDGGGPGSAPVRIRLQGENGQARLTVQDAGPGLAESELSRVFDRFYRVAGSPGMGTGLGLAIARRVAELHGGTITLINTNPGLRAEVILPAQPAVAQPA